MRSVLAAAALLACLLPAAVPALAATSCPEDFAGGAEPALLNPRLADRARLICLQGYAVLHSGLTRGPLWSAEHLTAERVEQAREIRRVNRFHPEDSLPLDERSELSDYARSGWDRGHMTPSGDAPDAASQADTFSLANIVPQAHRLNTGAWTRIETAVRTLAEQDGELYVVTGPVFQGSNLQALRGRVLVPTGTYKAVYDPRRGTAGAYVCTNVDQPRCQTISIAQLRALTGLDVFPSLPEQVKAAPPALPQLRPPRRPRRTSF
jgi:endonuclease G, mitochondrial